MPKVSGLRPVGYKKKKEKKKKKKQVWSLRNMGKKKEENGARGRRDRSKRQCTMKSTFIHTVSSNYHCIYSIC